MLKDADIERYARQLVMAEIGEEGQEKLLAARILVIGAGGLGAAVICALAGAGIGRLGLIDGDRVDNSNLNRQFIHTTDRIGQPKTLSASEFVAALNPEIDISVHDGQFDALNANQLVSGYDLVMDCTDSPSSRYLINHACLMTGKPLIFGGAVRTDGQATVILPELADCACLHCIFPRSEVDYDQAPSCAQTGILGTTTMMVGAIQAQEAIKYITGFGELLTNRLWIYDGMSSEVMLIDTRKDSDCPVCAEAGRQVTP
jgi:molybdopterin/thiamine biosynthesis adenylyltransferase